MAVTSSTSHLFRNRPSMANTVHLILTYISEIIDNKKLIIVNVRFSNFQLFNTRYQKIWFQIPDTNVHGTSVHGVNTKKIPIGVFTKKAEKTFVLVMFAWKDVTKIRRVGVSNVGTINHYWMERLLKLTAAGGVRVHVKQQMNLQLILKTSLWLVKKEQVVWLFLSEYLIFLKQ